MQLCRSSKIFASMNASETGSDMMVELERTGMVEGASEWLLFISQI